VVRTLDHTAQPNPAWSSDKPDPGTSSAPARIYNIGNHQPVELLHFIEVLERTLGKKADMTLMPLQPGDVPATYADIEDLDRDVGFKPSTPIEVGVPRFVEWYRSFYKV
jgi:UDP-glucuronate 4-epimerase